MNIGGKLFSKINETQEWFSGCVVIYKSFCINNPKKIGGFESRLENSSVMIGQWCYSDPIEKDIAIRFKEEYLRELEQLEENSIIYLQECLDKEISNCDLQNMDVRTKLTFEKKEYDEKTMLHPSLVGLKIIPYDKGTKIELINYERENLDIARELDEYNESLKKDQYGNKYFEDRNHYVLQPVSFRYNERDISLAYVTIDTFSNGMAVLRMVIPVNKQPMELIEKRSFTPYVEEMILPGFLDELVEDRFDFYEISTGYMKYICNVCKVEMFSGDAITHYVVSESSYKIKKFSQIKDKAREDLFKIIKAPYNHTSTLKKEVAEFFEKSVYGRDYVKTLISTKGECVSICEESKNVVIIEGGSNEEHANYKIASAVQFSELAIVILTLLKSNYQFTYNSLNMKMEAVDVINLFRSNLDYIYSLYESCYGSVREQIDFFKNSMEYYLSEDIYLRRIKYIQENINEKREQQISSLSITISVLTIIFTIIFGLPAIQDTFSLVANYIGQLGENLVLNPKAPVVIWIVTIIIIIYACRKTLIHSIKLWYSKFCYKYYLLYKVDFDRAIKIILKNTFNKHKGFILFMILFILESLWVILS